MAIYNLISHAGTGKALSVCDGPKISQNKNVCILTQNPSSLEQQWSIAALSGNTRLFSNLNAEYGLNIWRGSKNKNNCDIHTVKDNTNDSLIAISTASTDIFCIKLANYNLCLTAQGSTDNSNVNWEAPSGAINQQWKAICNDTPPVAAATNGYIGSVYTDKIGVVVAGLKGRGYADPAVNRFHGSNTGYINQCTWYAWGRAYERYGAIKVTGNAGKWFNNIVLQEGITKRDKSLDPIAKSIAVFQKTGEAGHVVFVEEVSGGDVYFTEGNNSNTPDGSVKKKPIGVFKNLWGKQIAGYIVLS